MWKLAGRDEFVREGSRDPEHVRGFRYGVHERLRGDRQRMCGCQHRGSSGWITFDLCIARSTFLTRHDCFALLSCRFLTRTLSPLIDPRAPRSDPLHRVPRTTPKIDPQTCRFRNAEPADWSVGGEARSAAIRQITNGELQALGSVDIEHGSRATAGCAGVRTVVHRQARRRKLLGCTAVACLLSRPVHARVRPAQPSVQIGVQVSTIPESRRPSGRRSPMGEIQRRSFAALRCGAEFAAAVA